jgi:hypothetical protein
VCDSQALKVVREFFAEDHADTGLRFSRLVSVNRRPFRPSPRQQGRFGLL